MGDIKKLKKIIFILGMHRSGTSALTRMVNVLGISLGKNLLKGNSEINAKGFWENRELIETHDRIFEKLNSSWFDFRELPPEWWLGNEMHPFVDDIETILSRDFEDQSVIALKDPRLCRLFPLWVSLAKKHCIQVACILAVRNPVEVSRSLSKRDGFDSATINYLWLTYVLDSEFYNKLLISFYSFQYTFFYRIKRRPIKGFSDFSAVNLQRAC